MAEFDLSVLNTLNEKFVLLETQLKHVKDNLEEKERKLMEINADIEKLESQKLSISVDVGSIQVEYAGLKDIYEEKKKQYKDIQENAFIGRNVKKKLIPKEIIQKYRLSNLWVYNLPSAWRLLYTITPSKDVRIITAILDWMDHKDYERLFNF